MQEKQQLFALLDAICAVIPTFLKKKYPHTPLIRVNRHAHLPWLQSIEAAASAAQWFDT